MCIIKFEWDPEKARENYRKHGVSFEQATVVFSDVFGLEEYDSNHSTFGETRYSRIGFAADGILYVVYTMRDPNEDLIRLISARRADRSEQQLYIQERYGKERIDD